jgi:copper chaperone CopZ
MTMVDTLTFSVGGMTCEGCSGRVRDGLLSVTGVSSAEVSHETGTAVVQHDSVSKDLLSGAVKAIGYTVDGEGDEYHWKDGSVWRQSASNTKWCLIGCSVGEFGTLAYYSASGITEGLTLYSNLWYFYALLPLLNGLATSVMLETFLLIRGQMDLRNALSTALGMSFISMLMMEIAMEITDLLFTGGSLGMNYFAIPLMLLVGFLTPWPYNYWRLKKYGVACH